MRLFFVPFIPFFWDNFLALPNSSGEGLMCEWDKRCINFILLQGRFGGTRNTSAFRILSWVLMRERLITNVIFWISSLTFWFLSTGMVPPFGSVWVKNIWRLIVGAFPSRWVPDGKQAGTGSVFNFFCLLLIYMAIFVSFFFALAHDYFIKFELLCILNWDQINKPIFDLSKSLNCLKSLTEKLKRDQQVCKLPRWPHEVDTGQLSCIHQERDMEDDGKVSTQRLRGLKRRSARMTTYAAAKTW